MKRSRMTTFLLAFMTLFALTAGPLSAEQWPQWRGPRDNGISAEKNIPIVWGEKDSGQMRNVAWRLPLPGAAGATPVVWNDRIWLTSVDGRDLVLMCVSTAGKELWRRTVATGNRSVRRDEGNMASPSPITDGTHVWTTMATGVIACFDVNGREIWKVNLDKRYGPLQIAFGMSSTPVLFKNRLYLQLIHGDGRAETHEALVVALNAATGDEVWKVGRVTGAVSENEQSYASPMIYNHDGAQFLLTHGGDFVIAHRLSDGGEIWRCGLNVHDNPRLPYHPTLRFVASPVTARGIIVVPTAKNREVIALRPGFRGDITHNKAARIWMRPRNTPDVPSPLVYGGLVYLCRENGNLICLDQKTGREVYQRMTHRQRHRASPVFIDGNLYLTARDGRISVVRAGRKFKLIAQNNLHEPISASPAVSNGTLYLRSFETLWAIRKTGK